MAMTEREIRGLLLLDAAHRDPDRVYRDAVALSDSASTNSDGAAVVIAERAAGLASRERGDLATALVHFRRSIDAAEHRNDGRAAAESRSLLAGCMGQAGDLSEGLRVALEAQPFLAGPALGLCLVHTGFLLFHLDRPSDALDTLNRACELLGDESAPDARAAALNNRGIVNWQAGNLEEAMADLDQATLLYEGLGRGAAAAKIRHNAGMVRVSANRVFEGLDLMARADEALDVLGIDRSSGLLDRCRTLTRIGLFGDALELGRSMAPFLLRSNSVVELAELGLVLAEAGLQHDDYVAAGAFATQAAMAFEFQGRFDRARSAKGLSRLVDLLLSRSVEQRLPDVSTVDPTCVVHAARRLLESGADELALGLAYQAQTAMAGMSSGSARQFTVCFAAGIVGAVLADCGALQAAIDAAETWLARTRIETWPVEFRALGLRRMDELCAIAVGASVRRGDMREAVAYVERARRERIAPTDSRAAELGQSGESLHLLRTTSRTASGIVDSALEIDRHEEQRGLEDRVRHDDWLGRAARAERPEHGWSAHGVRVQRPGNLGPPDGTDLSARWRNRSFVSFAEVGNDLHAFVVTNPNDPSIEPQHVALTSLRHVRRLIEDLRHHIGQWAWSRVPSQTLSFQIRSLAVDLAAVGFEAIADLVGDREVVVSPSASLTAVPWALIPGWGGRPVTVAASMSSWAPFSWCAPRNPMVVVGPNTTHGAVEAASVARLLGAGRVFAGHEATSDLLRIHIEPADSLHICAHGTYRTDHPLLSSVQLVDGELTMYDLRRASLPPFVVMSACDFGSGAAAAGSGPLGLLCALSGLGCERLVASFCPVAETEVTQLMETLYGLLQDGPSDVDVATMLAAAQRTMIDNGALSVAGFQMLAIPASRLASA
jgi:tetratricopeptide (TPR) repeat protein